MPSLITLAQLETRVKNALSASAPASHWAAASIDEAISLALEEYSRAKPYAAIFTITPTAREFDLTPSPYPLQSVLKIWYPYTVATPEYPPAWIDFDFQFHAGSPMVRLRADAVPDGVKVARVFYNALHTLNGLAGGVTTTWLEGDDAIMVVGACAYACLQRSTELDETLQNMAVSTPNYGALSQLFFDRFHAMLFASRGVHL
jgi:hypothetical protein